MHRKKFIQASVIAGLGTIVPVKAMSKLFLKPKCADEMGWFDGTPTERFQQLKTLAQNGTFELSVAEFCNDTSVIQKLFDKMILKIEGIKILNSTADTLLLVSESRDFLFSKNIFKNDKVAVECEFQLIGDELNMLMLCQPDSPPKKLSSITGEIGNLLKPIDFIKD